LEATDFVKGHLLGICVEQRHTFPRLRPAICSSKGAATDWSP